MHSRRGSVLLIVLIVLLLLIAGVAIIQQLSVENAHRSQSLLLFEDGLQRADGVVEMLVSRFKREMRYSTTFALPTPDSGEERGIWDDRRYDLGWEVDRPTPTATEWRMWVWVQFPDDRPRRTHRFDLVLRLPATLQPQVAILTGEALDPVDPRSAVSRKAAVKLLLAAEPERTRAAARAESWTDLLGSGSGGEAPEAFALRAAQGPSAGEVKVMEDILHRMDRCDRSPHAADRLTAARALFDASRNLERRWLDLARFELAGALMKDAEFADPATRRLELAEALGLLEAALAPTGACCGEPKVAWRWANLKMRLRASPSDPAELVTTRRQVVTRMLESAGRPGFFHRRTDIGLRELPPYLEQLWQARVAASVQVSPTSYLLVSVREDGTVPLVHAETTAPVEPLSWLNDGSSIVVMGHAAFKPQDWRGGGANTTHFHVPLEGLEPIDVEPGNGYYPAPDTLRSYYTGMNVSHDDQTSLVNWCRIEQPLDAPYASGGPGAYLVRGRRHIELVDPLGGGPYAQIAVLSPTGDRILLVMHNDRLGLSPGMYVMSTDRAVDVAYRTTRDRDFAGAQRGSERPPVLVTLPAELPAGGAMAGLSWDSFPAGEWLACTVTAPTGTRVHFWQTAPLVAGGAPTELVSTPLPFDEQVAREYPYFGRMGLLVHEPPGYLVSAKDALYLVPLPGSAVGATPAAWPVDLAGQLTSITDLSSPPWGENAFFAARVRGQPYSLMALDLRSGRARALLGPGGVMEKAREVGRVAVSPVPESRLPEQVPVPE